MSDLNGYTLSERLIHAAAVLRVAADNNRDENGNLVCTVELFYELRELLEEAAKATA